MKRLRAKAAGVLVLAALGTAGACGDAPTEDRRGYTKAPLEEPEVFITAEEETVMDRLGDPVAPEVVDPEALAEPAAPAGS